MRNLNFIPNIFRHVFISINFAPILFSMYTKYASGNILEGGLKNGAINAVRLLVMAPNIMSRYFYVMLTDTF
jgi:hypothetical protein